MNVQRGGKTAVFLVQSNCDGRSLITIQLQIGQTAPNSSAPKAIKMRQMILAAAVNIAFILAELPLYA